MQSGFGCIGFCCFGILVNGIKSSSVNKLHAVTVRIDCALQKAHAFYDAPNLGDDGKRAAPFARRAVSTEAAFPLHPSTAAEVFVIIAVQAA